MAVLWPDSDDARARQSLRNSLYQIRRSAGADVLSNRGAVDLGVNPSRLVVDAVEFRAAVAEERFEDAVELYQGRFLSGFHLDDAPEFEEWAGRIRRSLEADAQRVLLDVARLREDSGDIEGALRLLQRAQALAPADEEILRHRLILLEGQGNRAAAVAEGEAWVEALRSRLEMEPSEPTLRLMEDLRSGHRRPDPLMAAPASPTASLPTRETGPVAAVADLRAARGARRSWARLPWLLTAVVGAILAWIALRPTPSAEPPLAGGVIVNPFEADSAVGGRVVGRALGSLMARYFQPEIGGLVLPVDEGAAASFDGRNRPLIAGRIRAVGGRRVAEVTLASTANPGKVRTRATVSAEDGDLEAFAIRLVSELRRGIPSDLPERGPIPRFTRAPGAVVPYFEGEIHAREGRTAEARDAYRRALALDSTFAMAWYRLSVTEELLSRSSEAAQASDRAAELSASLTTGERNLLDAWRAYRGAGVVQALPRYEALAAARGPDPEVWLRVAELRFHWGSQLGIPRDSAAAAFRALLRLTPDDATAVEHLLRLMGPTGDASDLEAAIRRYDPAHTTEELRNEAAAIVALNGRHPLDDGVVTWLSEGSFADESRRLTSLAASARVPYDLAPVVRALPRSDDAFVSTLRWLLTAQLAASAGRMREAYAALDTLATSNPYRALEYRAFLAVTSPVAPPADRLRALQRHLRSQPAAVGSPIGMWTVTQDRLDTPRALVLDAMLTRGLGEPVDTTVLMARGRAASHVFDPAFARYLRAVVLAGESNHPRVLVTLGPGSPETGTYPDPLSYLVGTSKWARIQSLLALGRDEEALRWLETIPDFGGYDLLYVAPASLLRGRILERLGRNRDAAAAYGRAAELWEEADPDFEALRQEALDGAARTGGAQAS
ncbi:MAG TPA: BTAD domain-containing putative transcriptional regulator [Longimicrobiales bacterium]|nr:BTAD domain-containing putative transcriptional regulator [Longimicrobiales bacterium]